MLNSTEQTVATVANDSINYKEWIKPVEATHFVWEMYFWDIWNSAHSVKRYVHGSLENYCNQHHTVELHPPQCFGQYC